MSDTPISVISAIVEGGAMDDTKPFIDRALTKWLRDTNGTVDIYQANKLVEANVQLTPETYSELLGLTPDPNDDTQTLEVTETWLAGETLQELRWTDGQHITGHAVGLKPDPDDLDGVIATVPVQETATAPEPYLRLSRGERALLVRYEAAIRSFQVNPNRAATRAVLAIEKRLRKLKEKKHV